jgi:hypothetical protein
VVALSFDRLQISRPTIHHMYPKAVSQTGFMTHQLSHAELCILAPPQAHCFPSRDLPSTAWFLSHTGFITMGWHFLSSIAFVHEILMIEIGRLFFENAFN